MSCPYTVVLAARSSITDEPRSAAGEGASHVSGRAACVHDPFPTSHRLALDANRVPKQGTRLVYGISAHDALLRHHSRSCCCCALGWPGCHAEPPAHRMRQAASTAGLPARPTGVSAQRPACATAHAGPSAVATQRSSTISWWPAGRREQDATGAWRRVMPWPRCARCCSTAAGHGTGSTGRSSPCAPVDPDLMRATLFSALLQW